MKNRSVYHPIAASCYLYGNEDWGVSIMREAACLVVVALLFWSGSARAEFALSPADEAKEVAFCKSLPRPAGVGPEVPINDYCGCWVGNAENEWTQDEYSQWKAAAQGQGAMSPSLSAKVSSAIRECVADTSHAK